MADLYGDAYFDPDEDDEFCDIHEVWFSWDDVCPDCEHEDLYNESLKFYDYPY